MNTLIFNLDIYFQCAGHCTGCFLSQEERQDNQFVDYVFQNDFFHQIKNLIEKKITEETQMLIIGFGRGNILSASDENLHQLAKLIKNIDQSIQLNKKFEISTSLIGKIDPQIKKAQILLSASSSVYFNVVINSDIISTNFWNNWRLFYQYNQNFRKKHSIIDDADILVLNINPDNLPNIHQLYQNLFINDKMILSPINVAMFPYQRYINEDDLLNINLWMKQFNEKFHEYDINYKNFLEQLNQFSIHDFSMLQNYFETNQNSYVFIDKYNQIQQGSLSIMGEIDYHRLNKKFDLKTDIKNFMKIMNKNSRCIQCEHQTSCILSGAYLVAVQNHKMKKNKVFLIGKNIQQSQESYCLNGYQEIFEYYKKKI